MPKKTFVGFLLLFVVTAAFGRNAVARIVGAFGAGRPLDNVPLSCFKEAAGAVTGSDFVTSTCRPSPTLPRWEVPLPVYGVNVNAANPGYLRVIWFAKADGFQGLPTCCTVYSVGPNGGIAQYSRQCATTGSFEKKREDCVCANHLETRVYLACDSMFTPSQAVSSIDFDDQEGENEDGDGLVCLINCPQ